MKGILFIVISTSSFGWVPFTTKTQACYEAFAPRSAVVTDCMSACEAWVYEVNFDSGTIKPVICPSYQIMQTPEAKP